MTICLFNEGRSKDRLSGEIPDHLFFSAPIAFFFFLSHWYKLQKRKEIHLGKTKEKRCRGQLFKRKKRENQKKNPGLLIALMHVDIIFFSFAT